MSTSAVFSSSLKVKLVLCKLRWKLLFLGQSQNTKNAVIYSNIPLKKTINAFILEENLINIKKIVMTVKIQTKSTWLLTTVNKLEQTRMLSITLYTIDYHYSRATKKAWHIWTWQLVIYRVSESVLCVQGY